MPPIFVQSCSASKRRTLNGAIRYFLSENYTLYILIWGLGIILNSDVFFEKREKTIFKDGLLILGVLSVVDFIEHIAAGWNDPSKLRRIMLAINYSLRPVLVLGFIFLIKRKIDFKMFIPAIINFGFCIASIYNGCVFRLDADNERHIGSFGFIPPLIGITYLIILLGVNINGFRLSSFWERFMLLFMVAAVAAALAVGGIAGVQEIYNPSFAAIVVLYYLFCYSQLTRRDALTKLYNRQTFFSDSRNMRDEISGIISIDLNELKWINDNMGHAEGDRAIKTVSECFIKCTEYSDKVYRVGGDEFVVLCFGRGANEIKLIVQRIKLETEKAGYSCAIGVSLSREGMSIDDLLTEADARMYEDKAEMKRIAAENGTVLHLRENQKGM